MRTPTPSPSPPPPESRPYLHAIDRTCRRGIPKYELTSFFASPAAIAGFVNDLVAHFAQDLPGIDAIVGLDALGLPLAGALGYATLKPVIVARKGGKVSLPAAEVLNSEREGVQVGERVIEIRRDLLVPGMKVLVVDEWIDTGAQVTTVTRLLESVGVVVAGIGTLELREGRKPMADALLRKYKVFAGNRVDE